MQNLQDSISASANNAMRPEDNRSDAVVAKIPQGCNAKINIRVVPGRNFQINPALRRCRPRQGASRREAEPLLFICSPSLLTRRGG